MLLCVLTLKTAIETKAALQLGHSGWVLSSLIYST